MQPPSPATTPPVDASGEPPRAHPRLAGMALAQLAGVRAGLAAGFPLEDALQNEGVNPARYAKAEAAWDERLAEDDAEELQHLFDTCQADAAERYRRPVPPLDEDIGAWLDFARHFAAQEEPLPWLAGFGLRLADVFTLHRWWSKRLAEEPSLREHAHRLLAATPGDVPTPRPGQGILRPPAPLGEMVDLPEDEEPIDDEDVGDDDDAPEADPADFFAPLPHEGDAKPMAPAAAIEPRPQPPAPDPDRPVDTLPPGSIAGAPSMPFQKLPLPQPLVSFAPEPAEAEPVDRLAQTLPAPVFVPTDPLPFQREATLATGDTKGLDLGSTLPVGFVAPREALPFQEPIKGKPAATKNQARAVTQPLPVFVPGEALPFEPKHDESTNEDTGPATTPLDGSAPPELSLEAHAELCAKLAASPDDAEQIFAQFGLAEPHARKAVDEAWKERLRKAPALYQEWQRLYRMFSER
ncbi:hypothetical protein [Polyangium mundeleinium]|uniref:Uncharacterized protein n=1 Tax=Polyangium mundeleinium TaxID=2995306 RepID=A0ABT5ELL9_9BACT|nr:hypothetical protein [Polyangium mundeleinium]MDC0741625.1 hypothetical protein [Polyangium mundeleinium]